MTTMEDLLADTRAAHALQFDAAGPRAPVLETTSLERALASANISLPALRTCSSLAELDGLHAAVAPSAWSA